MSVPSIWGIGSPSTSFAQPAVLRELLLAGIVSVSFAILVGFVSTNLEPQFVHRAETVRQQFAILAGGGFPIDGILTEPNAYQNRVLFPLVLLGLSSIGLASSQQWYLVLRLATAMLAFLAFWYLLRVQARTGPKLAVAGVGLLAYELVFTFNHGWEHPTDFPDILFTTLWIAAAIKRRRWSLFAVAVAAAFNRESAAFAGVFWIVMHGFTIRWRPRLREIAFGTGVSAASYATVLCVRVAVGGPLALTDNANVADVPLTSLRLLEAVTAFVAHPLPWSWPVLIVAMATLPALWIWANRSHLIARDQRVLLAAFVILLLSLAFSRLEEPRDFTTSIVLVVFVAAAAEQTSRIKRTMVDASPHENRLQASAA